MAKYSNMIMMGSIIIYTRNIIMREVCVFFTPSLYDSNPHLVDGLIKNEIQVCCFDDTEQNHPQVLVQQHQERLRNWKRDMSVGDDDVHCCCDVSPLLCIALEDTRAGVRAARRAGMTVVGIAPNRIEMDRLHTDGAHVVALSISDLLETFGIRNYYQVQYLPYTIHLDRMAKHKVGYPVSLLDTIKGKFIKNTNNKNIPDDEEEVEDESLTSSLLMDPTGISSTIGGVLELDPNANRIIPREVLGIIPNSLADVYINNVGWPQDNIRTFRLNSRELERDIVYMMAKLYEIQKPEIMMRGFVTNGGTEGNFTGLWWQRDYLKELSGGNKPILLLSEQAHYSVAKAAQQLDIEGMIIKANMWGEIDCVDLARVLDDIQTEKPNSPILMLVTFGTTQTGALDDLPLIHRLLVDKVKKRGGNFSIHLDAALMGAVIPITKPFGSNVDYFRDFSVKTLAISGHKFFGSVCICGILLTTVTFLNDCFSRRNVDVAYVMGLHDITPSGSRSGFNVLSLHNTLCGLYLHTDAHRLRLIVAQCYRNVDYFRARISEIVGPDNVIHPAQSLTVCFPKPSDDLMEKYSLMPVKISLDGNKSVDYAGVCILVNVGPTQINKFLMDYTMDTKDAGKL